MFHSIPAEDIKMFALKQLQAKHPNPDEKIVIETCTLYANSSVAVVYNIAPKWKAQTLKYTTEPTSTTDGNPKNKAYAFSSAFGYFYTEIAGQTIKPNSIRVETKFPDEQSRYYTVLFHYESEVK